MKNLIDLAQGVVMLGGISAVLYGPNTFLTDEYVKNQLSFKGRTYTIEEARDLKDIYSKVFFAGAGTAIAGGCLLYFAKKRDDEQ